MAQIFDSNFGYKLVLVLTLVIFASDAFSYEKSHPSEWRLLNDSLITEFTTGIVTCKREEDFLHFFRFPAEVMRVFQERNTWQIRSRSTSGVKIEFITNSPELLFSGVSYPDSPQNERFTIKCNGFLIQHLPVDQQSGKFTDSIQLHGEGEKRIEILFPGYACGAVNYIAIRENSSLKPGPKRKTIFALGNSITQAGGKYQGYLQILAENLNMDLHCAGVGGHVFQEDILPYRYLYKPEIITIAYGTNDWSGSRAFENIVSFLSRVDRLYPDTPVFVIEPLHRYKPRDPDNGLLSLNNEGKSLDDYRSFIRCQASKYSQMKVLSHKELLPDDPGLFSDGIHPNFRGHKLLGQNLTKKITEYLNHL